MTEENLQKSSSENFAFDFFLSTKRKAEVCNVKIRDTRFLLQSLMSILYKCLDLESELKWHIV